MLGSASGVVSNNTDRRRIYQCAWPPFDVRGLCRRSRDWLGWNVKGRVMRSMKGLRVVVVTDSDHGHALAARLRRMECGNEILFAWLVIVTR